MACVRDLRLRAKDFGDEDGLEEQEEVRAKWLWENSLRRHNFVGFVGELLKGVAKAKLEQGDGAYDKWVEDAKKRTRETREKARKQGMAVE
jgi:ubiquitin carboxyl-terminal hydrolase L5